MNNNQLTGTIPTELGNLGKLKSLRVHRNLLRGSVNHLGKLNLTDCDLVSHQQCFFDSNCFDCPIAREVEMKCKVNLCPASEFCSCEKRGEEEEKPTTGAAEMEKWNGGVIGGIVGGVVLIGVVMGVGVGVWWKRKGKKKRKSRKPSRRISRTASKQSGIGEGRKEEEIYSNVGFEGLGEGGGNEYEEASARLEGKGYDRMELVGGGGITEMGELPETPQE